MNFSKKISAFAIAAKKNKKTDKKKLYKFRTNDYNKETSTSDVGTSNDVQSVSKSGINNKINQNDTRVSPYTYKRRVDSNETLNHERPKTKRHKKEAKKSGKLEGFENVNDKASKTSKSSLNQNTVESDEDDNCQQFPLRNYKKEKVPSYMQDSRTAGRHYFEWLIHPYDREKFFREIWEKKPLLVKRNNSTYYDGLFSCTEFDKILREKNLKFGKNLDITSYENDERKTLNPDGKAYPSVVWDYFATGCSVRLLNPQTFSRTVWKLNSVLQEFFNSFVGSNVYLTPAGTQGFAPHYDDIEAFVLQLEGKKIWKVYPPLDEQNTLPRFSSGNFKRAELKTQPLITVELEPGDLLYFPRGFIHEAKSSNDVHSLHITLSAAQKHSWGDFMEKLLPRALSFAIEDDIEFRESLPLNYLHYAGIANQDMDNSTRDEFLHKIQRLMAKLIAYAPIDSSVDQMAKDFIHDSLPPVLAPQEKAVSIHTHQPLWKNNSLQEQFELQPDTRIKLIRHGAVRLVMEEEGVRLYHSLENSREYHEFEPLYVEIGADLAPAVEHLLHAYPAYVTIEDLPLSELDEKMEIANLLFDKGLVTVEDKFDDSE